jgi:hypothetical protein
VLPGFDELLFGYEDRSPTLPAERDDAVLGNNGRRRNTVVSDGRVVATWTRPRLSIEPPAIEGLVP